MGLRKEERETENERMDKKKRPYWPLLRSLSLLDV